MLQRPNSLANRRRQAAANKIFVSLPTIMAQEKFVQAIPSPAWLAIFCRWKHWDTRRFDSNESQRANPITALVRRSSELFKAPPLFVLRAVFSQRNCGKLQDNDNVLNECCRDNHDQTDLDNLTLSQ